MSNAKIESLVAILDQPIYQLRFRLGANLFAQVVKNEHFIEPLVSLSVNGMALQEGFCFQPTCPYGSLSSIELKAQILNNGERKVEMRELENGFERNIIFQKGKDSMNVTYTYYGTTNSQDFDRMDFSVETILKQSIMDGMTVRRSQLKSMFDSRDIIKEVYEKEIEKSSDEVINLVQKSHEVSRNFYDTYALIDNGNLARGIAAIKNILTLGATNRYAQRTLGNIASGYIAWAVLEEKLNQGADLLEEDAKYIDSPELNELSKTFRHFVTKATYSKNRVWRVYQTQKDDLAKLGFYPKVLDEEILRAQEILTTSEKKVIYD